MKRNCLILTTILMGLTATIADFQVLSDAPFTLDAATNSREATFNFSVPSDIALNQRMVLAVQILPFQNDSRFKVFMNNREVWSLEVDKSMTRGLWETFPASTPFPEGSSFGSTVPIKISMNISGKIRFSDMVIWYQVKK